MPDLSAVIIVEELKTRSGKRVGLLTLNDTRSLNSLSLEMIRALTPQLLTWQDDNQVVAVVLQGAGDKAFCAGGNIRKLYDSLVAEPEQVPNELALAFFSEEYRLNYLIHTYRKPFIVWGHGIVMGGGIGLMSGASHRVVTEASRLAMPEMAIGLFPDVGGTWFLNQAPGRIGLFLGLTGAHMNAADALFVGLADYVIPHAEKASLFEQLLSACWFDDDAANHEVVSAILRKMEAVELLSESNVCQHLDLINEVTMKETLSDIVQGIASVESDNSWWQRAVKAMQRGCPVTANLVYEQILRGAQLSLVEVFQLELVMALQCAAHPDFREGVRALLVDKDNAPTWQHKSISDVPAEWVNAHFQAPWEGDENPLKGLGQVL